VCCLATVASDPPASFAAQVALVCLRASQRGGFCPARLDSRALGRLFPGALFKLQQGKYQNFDKIPRRFFARKLKFGKNIDNNEG
jgi:hypothetical protein